MWRIVAIFGVALLALPSPAAAQFLKPGFTLPADRKPVVVVACPDMIVGSLNTRGEEEANAEWTRTAYARLSDALKAGPIGTLAALRFAPCDPIVKTPFGELLHNHINLRNSDVLFRVPPGTFPLPGNDLKLIKGLKGNYAYHLDRTLIDQLRANLGEGDYVLFLTMRDSYSTPGLKAEKLLGAMIGIPNQMPPHYANTMLVDLHSAEIVWTHMDGAVGGDPRTSDGAARRIAQVTRHFPGTK